MRQEYIFKDFKIVLEKDSSEEWGIHFRSPTIEMDEYSQTYSVKEIRSLLEKVREIILNNFKGETVYFYGFCQKRHRIFGKIFLSQMGDKVNVLEGTLEGDTFIFEVL